ncbi:hypothetical protein Bca4012_020361 [Brassica carinata]|uniref:AP2/ERF domain-containing protein n=1 Tax=Brassica carinata TaxID=52824 RepID=A0A8X8BCX7_BRACI|nr:hypothetical protein Bca52824_001262 [Brassica carinata]
MKIEYKQKLDFPMEKRGQVVINEKRKWNPMRPEERRYKGIRVRKWGKWVAEIREPNNRSRIWLGSYKTAFAAARSYHTAAFYLRGPLAKLNFPEQVLRDRNVVAGFGGECLRHLYGRRRRRWELESTQSFEQRVLYQCKNQTRISSQKLGESERQNGL